MSNQPPKYPEVKLSKNSGGIGRNNQTAAAICWKVNNEFIMRKGPKWWRRSMRTDEQQCLSMKTVLTVRSDVDDLRTRDYSKLWGG